MTVWEYFERLRAIESGIRRYNETIDAFETRIECLGSMGNFCGDGVADANATPRWIARLEMAWDRRTRHRQGRPKILSQKRGDIESIIVCDMGDSFRTLAGMHPIQLGIPSRCVWRDLVAVTVD